MKDNNVCLSDCNVTSLILKYLVPIFQYLSVEMKDYNMKLRSVSLNEVLPCNHYRIAIVLDNEGDHRDYHFYRQDSNGLWSHKDGGMPVTNKDASGKLIYDPKKADKNYPKKKETSKLF